MRLQRIPEQSERAFRRRKRAWKEKSPATRTRGNQHAAVTRTDCSDPVDGVTLTSPLLSANCAPKRRMRGAALKAAAILGPSPPDESAAWAAVQLGDDDATAVPLAAIKVPQNSRNGSNQTLWGIGPVTQPVICSLVRNRNTLLKLLE